MDLCSSLSLREVVSDSDSDGDDEVADRCSEADVVRRRVI